MTFSFILALVGFFALNGLACFNARFRESFFTKIWRLRKVFITFAVLWFVLPALLGPSTTTRIVTMLPQLLMSVITAIVFMVFQFGLMFWMMANANRPEVHLPGDTATKTWDDWIGSSHVKEELQLAVDSLHNWKLYEENGVKPLNGMLLYGPPGTGKSLAAKVVASQAGLPVIIASSSSLNGPFMGMGMMIVRGLSRRVRKLSMRYGGCVVFLDEIDSIGMARAGVSGGGFMPGMGMMGGGMGGNGTLQTLLTAMSGADSGETWFLKLRKRWGLAKKSTKHTWRILWMAATNVDLQLLDTALTRSGRFGSKLLPVNAPNDENRLALFELYLRKKKVSPELDFEQLVQLSRGMTGADIEEVCEAAARRNVYEKRKREGRGLTDALTDSDMFNEIRLKKNGQPRSVPLHESERLPIAVHEAGHGTAVVLYPPAGMRCSGATLSPTEDFLGAVMFERIDEISLMMKEDCYRHVLIAVSSRAAEEIVLSNASAGVSSDLNQAMRMALAMVEHYGLGDRLTSVAAIGGTHSPGSVVQAERIVNATFAVAKRLIGANVDAVNALAHALVDRVDLTGREVIELVESHATKPFESVAAEVEAVVASMKEEEKLDERASRLALPAASEEN